MSSSLPTPDQIEVCAKGTENALVVARGRIDALETRVRRQQALLDWVLGESAETPVAASFFDHPEAGRALAQLRDELRHRAAREAVT